MDETREQLGDEGRPPALAPHEEPPATAAAREREWFGDHGPERRDMRPAIGTRGEPGVWRRAVDGARVTLARPGWGDAVWSFIYKSDTRYAAAEPAADEVQRASERMRGGPLPVGQVYGPFIKPAVWSVEVPLYFWVGGIAAGASFAAFACDVAGDHDSAVIARRVAVGSVALAPPLLIADLGRPARFLNMLRIVKPRSPMNTGAWCLGAFSAVGATAVAADLLAGSGKLGRDQQRALARGARVLGGVNAVLGGYLGSYTGVLLAATAVPLWARSRLALGPIFVSTGAATGAAVCRLALVATGVPAWHPTRRALVRIETGAMLAELALSVVNQRRLGEVGQALRQGRGGQFFRIAKSLVRVGLGLQFVRGRRSAPRAQDVASVCFLLGGLGFRFAWAEAGKTSANDHEVVALTARDVRGPRESYLRSPLFNGRAATATRAWTGAVGRLSLIVDRVVRARPRLKSRSQSES